MKKKRKKSGQSLRQLLILFDSKEERFARSFFRRRPAWKSLFFCKGQWYRNVRKVRKVRNMKKSEDDRFLVSVKVGPKGQITIPAEARKMFDIKEGETLMVMGDKKRGIALLKADLFYALMEGNK
jgi:AbrB family looped-hinge helix DNA binding protein